MKLKIHPAFLLMGAVYIFFGKGWTFLAYLVAVVAHEYTHMLAARGRGIGCESIKLYPYGGEIKLNYVNIPTGEEIKIALAGPLMNLCAATLLVALWWVFPGCYSVTEPFYTANLATGLCNLIPVYPLDGGRVAVSLLKKRMTKYHAVLTAKWCGWAVCAAFCGFGIFAAVCERNFSLLSMAFFLFLGQLDIKTHACSNSFIDRRKKDLLKKGGLKENTIMVRSDTLLYELVTLSNRDSYYVFDVVDDDYRRIGRIEERELYDLCANNEIYTPIGGLVSRQKHGNLV